MSSLNSKLAGHLGEAAQLKITIEPRVKDRSFLKNNGTIIYAVDTDIIILYTDPCAVSVSNDNREGYAEVFSQVDQRPAQQLGQTLAEYIFHHLTIEDPLLHIPPHEDETQGVFFEIANKVGEETVNLKEEIESIEKLLKDYDLTENKEELIENLKKATPHFLRLRYGNSGSLSELKRFSDLLKRNRLYSFNHIVETQTQIHGIKSSLFEPLVGASQINFIINKDRWIERLSTYGKSKKNTKTIEDAKVLARLEQMNQFLQEKNTRLVLITGDHCIAEAAENYQLGDASFAELYIRHPKSFLADEKFLATVQQKDKLFTLTNWLDLFLSRFFNKSNNGFEIINNIGASNLELMTSQALKKDPLIGKDILKEWNELIESVAIRYSISDKNDDISDIADKAVADLILRLKEKDIKDIINEVIDEAWKDFFDIAVIDGLSLLYSGNEKKYPSRIAPIIRFFNNADAREYVERFLSSKAVPKQSDLEKLKAEKSQYPYYMAYAVLYASASRWSIANKLAIYALSIAESGDWKHLGIYGHESAFLVAVSIRRKSKNILDLNDVEHYLDIAEKKLLEYNNDNQDNSLDIYPDYRFEHERIALSQTRWLYYYFSQKDKNSDASTFLPLKKCIEKQLELIPKIKKRCDTGDELECKSLKLQAISNLFMLEMLYKFKQNKEFIQLEKIAEFQLIFKDFIETSDVVLSYAQRCIYNTISSLISSEDKSIYANELEVLIDSDLDNHLILPYDKARYNFLLEISRK